jgi:hypothetical protein
VCYGTGMKTIPNLEQIQEYIGNELLVKQGYAIYLSSIVDRVSDHFNVSNEDKKLLHTFAHRTCHNHETHQEKPTCSILEQKTRDSLRKLERDEVVSLIGGNFYQAGKKKYISRTPTASQVAYS